MNVGEFLTRGQVDSEKLALAFEEIRLTYGQLNEKVNRVANGLLNLGIKKGDRVSALMYNCHQFMEIYFALAKIGAIMVPLNFRLAARELLFALDDSGSNTLLIGPEFVASINSIRALLKTVRNFFYVGPSAPEDFIDYQSFFSNYPSQEPAVEVNMDDEQLIIYTSGTTGRPKGAVYTHSTTYWMSLNQIVDFGCNSNDIFALLGPLYHVGGLIAFSMPMFHTGGTCVMMRSTGFNPKDTLELIEKEKITIILLFPIMLYDILRYPDLKKFNTSSLRIVFSGGEPVPVAALQRSMEAFPSAKVIQGFGLTEGSAIASFLNQKYAISKMGSIGKPLAHVSMRVVDDKGEEVGPGEVGEILTQGPSVSKGYWMRSDANRETFAKGWCHTGDLGSIDEDGFFYIAGRKKDMIISGAENIYPAEVEDVLYAHPKISEVAVIGVPDEKWGEAVLAVVVPKAGQTLTEEEIIAFCKENLASYKKPKLVRFLDALPRTASMKVQKHVLRQQFAHLRAPQ